MNIKASGTPPVLASTPDAVETNSCKIFSRDETSAKAKKKPKVSDNAAERAESSKLRAKASRYIPVDIVAKLLSVNSPCEFINENRTIVMRGHPRNIAI
jgi:hypothetical protein